MASKQHIKTVRERNLARAVKTLKHSKFTFRSLFSSRIPFKYKFFTASFGLLILIIGMSIYLFWGLPNPLNLTRHPSPASTKLLDRHGSLIYEIFADQRRTPIKLGTLPDYVWQTTIAAEDRDFYKHSGFSPRGIGRAFISTFIRRKVQGGSTITQQLVKKALLSDERTLKRKIREFTLSVAVEMLYSKDQILEMYLNQVPYGGTAYGLESAARTYFGISGSELSLAQASLLAGLPAAPTYYSPFGAYPERAVDRQKYVLSQMRDIGYIDSGQYDSALKETLAYTPSSTMLAPHFALYVKDLLVDKYGLEKVEQGGLVVTTSLDLDLQQYAQEVVASETAKLVRENVRNGAALTIHPPSGGILAMVGSRDYFDTGNDGNVNVVLARRQPGSAIKPVNYALGLERRLITPATLLADKPTCFSQVGQKPYCPDNYDNSFHGATQVRFALGNSYNIPAVKTLVINGLTDFINAAPAFGLKTFKDPDQYGPSITLGGGEVTMLDLATAYSVFANAGKRVDTQPLISVRDQSGNTLESIPLKEISQEEYEKAGKFARITIGSKKYLPENPPNTRVVSAGTAFLISHILYDNGARSTTFGSVSQLNIKNHPEVSVKTGTTNDKRDNWTIGYNPDILVSVWVGNNDNSPMSRVASGVTGASPIWNKIMTHTLDGNPQSWPTQPAEVVGISVCSTSGLRVPENPDAACSPRFEYVLSGTQPPYDSGNRRDIHIYKPTQGLATAKQISEEPDQVEMQNHAVVFDALGTMLCVDCAGSFGQDTIRLDGTGKAIKN
ncbi:hypothetical protein A2395_04870 [Candidatus Amesbacteria bacterium RIFOXYB1_FULL_47_9]|uniref:Uncharacterized protein n=1 Tax=Candidatus Amesbacteria bacterium RIFOXYB1_FULL_47_9 TaxID=1797266 RepID=A0A1F4ZX52_9BACT|nr:MAG: hypothetical protein A2395_04870 [Candidatus Amesbacteria bacterium RIFOXYB1_FULL_47_9]